MQTEMIRLDPENPGVDGIEKAAGLIKAGELVVFPTETVYCLGASALDPGAVEKIYRAKGRPQDNPLIVHVSSLEMAGECTVQDLGRYSSAGCALARSVPSYSKSEAIPACDGGTEQRRAEVSFPSRSVEAHRGGRGTVAAPSANISGRPSPTSGTRHRGHERPRGRIILAGDTIFGLESTIVDLSERSRLCSGPARWMPGLANYCPDSRSRFRPNPRRRYRGEALSPGLKYRHYSPEIPLILIEESGNVVSRAGILARRKSVVLCSQELADYYQCTLKGRSRLEKRPLRNRVWPLQSPARPGQP